MANLLKELEIVEGDNSYLVSVYDEGANAKIGEVSSLKTDAKNNTVSAINELYDSIIATAENIENSIENVSNKVGTLSELNTSDKTSAVNAINEVNTGLNDLADLIANVGYVTPEDYGAVGDGVTDDSSAINDAIASGKPVRFISNYAIGSPINILQSGSAFIDGGGHSLIALSGLSDYMVKLNRMYGCIRNIILNANLLTTVPGCLLIYSSQANQSQFYLIDNLYTLNSLNGVTFGDGYTNAQSEYTIHGWRTRSIVNPLFVNQPNGCLWVTDSHLDATTYEWTSTGTEIPVGATHDVIHQNVGTLFIDNCTLESPARTDGAMTVYDITMTNCIVEIAGSNFNVVNYYGDLGFTDITISNCRFYDSQGSTWLTLGGGYTKVNLMIDNCKIYGSTGNLLYLTNYAKIWLRNVITSKAITSLLYGEIFECEGCTFESNVSYQLTKYEHSGASTYKGTKMCIASVTVSSSANYTLVLSPCANGAVISSAQLACDKDLTKAVIIAYGNAAETFNLGTTAGTIVDVKIFTVENGQGFQASSQPAAAVYPSGSYIADSTGATNGWVCSGGQIRALS